METKVSAFYNNNNDDDNNNNNNNNSNNNKTILINVLKYLRIKTQCDKSKVVTIDIMLY